MSQAMICIDGSQGEGGGQIVRSSLALSIVTGQPFTIERVRAGREKPGLKQQHVTAVRAAREICDAEVTGDSIGSSQLTFRPGRLVAGDYHFAVGTAGSATLVLQTVLPPLLIGDGPSQLVLEGGTHNPWAAPFDFLCGSYLPLVNRMGPVVKARLERHGFYPAGGGRFVVDIRPAVPGQAEDRGLSSFHLLQRGNIRTKNGRILLSKLPDHVADRELQELAQLTNWNQGSLCRAETIASGPGNAVILFVGCDYVSEVFSAIGEKGVAAESVARQAFYELNDYLQADVPVGPHLADQLLLPMGLCAWQPGADDSRRKGSFRTTRLTEHSRTHIEILRMFLGITITVEEDPTTGISIVTVG